MKIPKFRFVENGKEIFVPLERWAWGALYRPTDVQLARAEEATKERNISLQADLNERLKEMTDPKEILKLKQDYQEHMGISVEPGRDELHQFTIFDEERGEYHQVGEIDQSRVESFTLYMTPDMERKVVVDIPPGAKLVHFYKRFHAQEWAAGHMVTTYVIGYKLGDEYDLHFILPDDTVVCSRNYSLDWLRFIKFQPITL